MKELLVVMIDRKQKNLGGQERRWIRVANKLSSYCEMDVILNENLYELAEKTEININFKYIKIKENSIRVIDLIKKNIITLFKSFKYKKIHFCNQSILVLPTLLFLRIFTNKRLTFSYNGVSIKIHKKNKFPIYYWKILAMHKLAHGTEILNSYLLDEGLLNRGKVFISNTSFSDSEKFKTGIKNKEIIFSGHLYQIKGTQLLLKILESSKNRNFQIKIFGDSLTGDKKSEEIKKKILNIIKNNPHIKYEHRNNMEGVYESSTVFLSLQTITNYPSQSVIEALYSGCSVVMTSTGDSKKFGDQNWIKYIDENLSIDSIWNHINNAHIESINNNKKIEIFSKKKFSEEKYIENIKVLLRV